MDIELKEPPQIKSKSRVKDLAEVYTNITEVNAMLDLTEELSYEIKTKYFEPACGNGNFLDAILKRKLKTVRKNYDRPKYYKFYALRALSNIWGVDICPDNVRESKERLLSIIKADHSNHLNSLPLEYNFDPFIEAAKYILDKNIVCGNTLTGLDSEGNEILFSEFRPNGYSLIEMVYKFSDLYLDKPVVSFIYEKKYFLKLFENKGDGM